MKFRYLLAVDPSLTCSGWAVFEMATGRLAGVGKIKSMPSRFRLADRLVDLNKKITGLLAQLKLAENDLLVCESPTTMRDPNAAIKVEQVRGIFETIAHSRSVRVPGRINPRSIQRDVLGLRGRQASRKDVKAAASSAVSKLFESDLSQIGFVTNDENLAKHQDIVDAILVGYLAMTRVRSASYSGMVLEDMFLERRTPRGYRWAKGQNGASG